MSIVDYQDEISAQAALGGVFQLQVASELSRARTRYIDTLPIRVLRP
jgi:hypothetical protein